MQVIPNTDDFDRNCGSYALNLKEWFSFYICFNYPLRPAAYGMYLQAATRELLSRFPRLKQVDRDFVDHNPHKTIIAFRIGGWDWHFIVRRNHSWKGKRGFGEVCQYTKDEVLNEVWCSSPRLVYDSDIIFFAYR